MQQDLNVYNNFADRVKVFTNNQKFSLKLSQKMSISACVFPFLSQEVFEILHMHNMF